MTTTAWILVSFYGLNIGPLLVLHKCLSASVPNDPESWKSDWFEGAQRSLRESLEVQRNLNVAKNVILFLGDGMGVSTVTAGRIYAGQRSSPSGRSTGEEAQLSFDRFPHVGLVKTYNVDYQVADSAGTATAFLCGVKANLGTVGVDQNVRRYSCDDMTEDRKVKSIVRWSLEEGKRTGIVTTTRVTHATPAAGYAHSPSRGWETDSEVPTEHRGRCHDIAKQLVANNNDINVILGGGRRQFLPTNVSDPEYGSKSNGTRIDGVDLTQMWLGEARKRSPSSVYVWNKHQFDLVDPDSTDYLLGLFEPSNMKFALERSQHQDPDEPTLAEMTEKAIRILRRESKGYFLLVEGGRIDHGHHQNSAKNALEELVDFDRAVAKAVEMTNQLDTLIVVTADHSHSFTINGYPTRGNPILGFIDERGIEEASPHDGYPYLTLSYANGPSIHLGRTNLTGMDPESDDFQQPVPIPMELETHGGEDVAVYAVGPMSHLLHGVKEQHYVAHAMAYASCVGVNKDHCSRAGPQEFESRRSGALTPRGAPCVAAVALTILGGWVCWNVAV